jgi:hypothetical protein
LYNTNTTTPYMRVGPSMWDPPSCKGLLYRCCIGVVNLTFFIFIYSIYGVNQGEVWSDKEKNHVDTDTDVDCFN